MTSPVSLEPLELITAWHRLTCVFLLWKTVHNPQSFPAITRSSSTLRTLWCGLRRWLYCPQKDLSHRTAWGEELIVRADGLGPRWVKCGSQWRSLDFGEAQRTVITPCNGKPLTHHTRWDTSVLEISGPTGHCQSHPNTLPAFAPSLPLLPQAPLRKRKL